MRSQAIFAIVVLFLSASAVAATEDPILTVRAVSSAEGCVVLSALCPEPNGGERDPQAKTPLEDFKVRRVMRWDELDVHEIWRNLGELTRVQEGRTSAAVDERERVSQVSAVRGVFEAGRLAPAMTSPHWEERYPVNFRRAAEQLRDLTEQARSASGSKMFGTIRRVASEFLEMIVTQGVINHQALRWALEELASRDEQEGSWLGKNPSRMSSFSEVSTRLFDDARLGDAMESGYLERSYSAALCEKAIALRDAMSEVPEGVTPDMQIQHPNMVTVRQLSLELLHMFATEGVR